MDILEHPVLGKLSEEEKVAIYFEGQKLLARVGQTVASALIANGVYKLGQSRKLAQARGLFCGNGRCHSCLMTIDQVRNVRACSTLVKEGMEIKLNSGDPDFRRELHGN